MHSKWLFRSALCLALITIGARLQIPLPYFDYYTLQFTFVLLAAVMLPAKFAAGSVGAYIILGLVGLPVFAGGGGLGYVLRPSFGYLLGFLATAYALGIINERTKLTNKFDYFKLNMLGIFITYLFGLTYKALMLNVYLNQAVPMWTIITTAFAFDIPADIVMVFALSLVEVKIVKAVSLRVNESCDKRLA